jgi:sigma-B regulation protein RsbU (phosphoserine phosphatase)
MELCAAIKSSAGPLGKTPVVLVTAKAEMSAKLEGLSHGADDYLAKPFNIDELVCRTKNLVTVRRQERELTLSHDALKERDRLVKADLTEARSFQQALLPALPVSRGLAFATVYRPLDLVGGDFYDIIELAPGRFRIFLADATGHGVQASLRTVVLKAELERIQRASSDPASVLAALNRRLVTGYAPLELLCTACCVDVDVLPGGGAEVRIASAGHPAPLHVSSTRCVEIGGGGPFLGGPMSAIDLPCVSRRLARKDRLLVFSDGLCDERSVSGETFDVQKAVLALSREERELDASLRAMMNGFDAFMRRGTQSDDVTVVALECL